MSEEEQVVITGEEAYQRMRKGMGRKKIAILNQFLAKGTPEQVFQAFNFDKQGLHIDVQKLILLGMHYMKKQLEAKPRRKKQRKGKGRK